jgi:drug/metabolite transporter (DMT)-like permease
MPSRIFQQLLTYFRRHPYVQAVGFMLISTAAFSAMNVGVSVLTKDLDPTLIVMLRNGVALVLLLPFALRRRAALVRTTRLKSHFSRATVGSIGMIVWTYCLSIMPVSHATALSYTAPLFTTLFAVIFMGEKASRSRWLGLLAGFGGALVIIRPSTVDFEWSSLLVMLATTAWAVVGMLVKSLSRTEPALRIVFYMSLFMLLWSLPLGLYHWKSPEPIHWLMLLVIAVCSITMHFTMARAYFLAPVVNLMPFDFMRLIYTALFAYLLFGETSDAMTWLGAGIIIGSTVFIARRDMKAAPVLS